MCLNHVLFSSRFGLTFCTFPSLPCEPCEICSLSKLFTDVGFVEVQLMVLILMQSFWSLLLFHTIWKLIRVVSQLLYKFCFIILYILLQNSFQQCCEFIPVANHSATWIILTSQFCKIASWMFKVIYFNSIRIRQRSFQNMASTGTQKCSYSYCQLIYWSVIVIHSNYWLMLLQLLLPNIWVSYSDTFKLLVNAPTAIVTQYIGQLQ